MNIVNNIVNDVALTILAGSAIDPLTGIATVCQGIATDGGVSIIDGPAGVDTVKDITTIGPSTKVTVNNVGSLVLTTGYAAYVFNTIPSIDTTSAGADYSYTVASGKLAENISDVVLKDDMEIIVGGYGSLSTMTTSATSPNPVTYKINGTTGIIYWGDGLSDAFASGVNVTHTYASVAGNSIRIVPVDEAALTKFDCHSNQLTGSIPDLSSNTALTTFDCYINQLTGSIPDLSSNTALTAFSCSINQLTGSIPDLSSNTALTTFYCHANQLTGSIPDLSSNTALTTFYCSINQLTGSIPDLSSNTALTTFYCPANQLTGSIPDLSSNTALTTFHCHVNQLTGSIPDLSSNTALILFYCSTNQLTDYAGGTMSATCLTFKAEENALIQTAVDAILAALDTAGGSSGTCDLSGGTNAVPSASGLTSKSNLEARGWTVTVNA